MAETITILVKAGRTGSSRVVERHPALFEPRRTVRGATIGWATVETPDVTLRFPVIVEAPGDAPRVLFVADWQSALWSEPAGADPIDLADPEAVAEMMRTGAGTFVTPGHTPTTTARRFAC